MKGTRRLSVALHALMHMADRGDEPRTSEDLAACVGANAVVIRRTLGTLRRAGLVRSVSGPGGGWRLARAPSDVTVGGVCRALGERLLFTIDLGGPRGCRIQRRVDEALDGMLTDAERLLLAGLDRVTIEDLGTGRVRA